MATQRSIYRLVLGDPEGICTVRQALDADDLITKRNEPNVSRVVLQPVYPVSEFEVDALVQLVGEDDELGLVGYLGYGSDGKRVFRTLFGSGSILIPDETPAIRYSIFPLSRASQKEAVACSVCD